MTETNGFQLSQPGTFADPLTEVLRNGARALLSQAVEAEVAALLSAPTGARHHDACRQGDVSDDGRICRVRARHDSGTRPRRACEGQERGDASWSASDSPYTGETNP